MGIQIVVLLIQMIILVSIATAQTLPGCQDQETCGNVSIPYPFGTRKDCYYSKRFLITCNDTHFSPPVPFLRGSRQYMLNVTDISLDGQIFVYYPQAIDCYDSRPKEYGAFVTTFNRSAYTISRTQNKFTVVGCDSFGFIYGIRDGKEFSTGCKSVCGSPEYIENGTCSGLGCCQISIPKGLIDFVFAVRSYFNYTAVRNFSPCSYAFMVQEDKFNFSLNDLKDLRNVERHPLVFDWAIGNDTCEVAKMKTSYACKSTNSRCESRDIGYNCYCSHGYRGNPYIPKGCEDIDECKDQRLNNCTDKCTNIQGSYTCACRTGYRGDGRKGGRGCSPNTLYLVTVASISSCIGVPVLLIGIWWLWKILKRRKKNKLKEKFFKRNGGLLLQQQLTSGEVNVEKTKVFTSKELEKATDHYNENRILGQGGQGTVFKGMLADGRIVAIKQSKKMDEGQLEQFINEFVILSQINHRNIVKIFGCCLETEVPQLVYEFIPNGTLSKYVHEENEEFPLSWNKRVQIAAEVAGALSYLHSAASIPIYHRDIKTSNILLDEKYRAKVADFGTSKSLAIDQTHLTTRVIGTWGYLDPEYFQSSQFTEKSDVYSFGVVLVELLTGEKAISSSLPEEGKGLAKHFILAMKENKLYDILNTRVLKEGRKEEIMEFANLAKRCLNLNGKKRPTMKEVAMELDMIRVSLGASVGQKNYEEVEHDVAELKGPWDFTSASTGSYIETRGSLSIDVQPLLIK